MDPLYLLLVFSAMSMVPLLAVMVTSYTKIIIVTSLLRNALGLQNVPPPTVTSGIAIILTFFVMYPVGYEALGKQDHLRGGMQLGSTTQMLGLAQSAREPLRKFLAKHSGEKERQFFLQTAKEIMPPEVAADIKPDDLVILAPAFTLSELTSAFEIGFLLFLPFILIDIIVATVIMTLGMQMLSPTIISLPFKLLLFVVLDGWTKLFQVMVLSYR
ncbi:MAG: type III secretion system export apparatus subunit SctR [Limnohabitans sp.]|uniref:type III secretion system export apparatus subunit SctR n=1 Tax=Limnohabitans sp. TaxID=1907725 RepID=UPI0025FA86DD|nr:type III secretion system export apparatus subunit SctR [Limnohabitans sp.]MCO4087697.1 type III secretion system export apparatus subunit SctR [Limnohabitans sp.]